MSSNVNIGWINGHWGPINQLTIPIDDRGLNLGDGIFETVLIYKGKAQLLTSHLNRWYRSASLLNMAAPPSETWIRPLIAEAIQRSSLNRGNGALRLNWSRGDKLSRGIKIQTDHNIESSHRFWLEVNSGDPKFNGITTLISCREQRNANSLQSQCKTFAYGQSIQAKYEANKLGYDDALLLSTNGELCCGTTANILIKRKNQWITPRLQSGCLPGIMRQKGIECGLFKEAKISKKPSPGDEWLLINSLSCRPIKQLHNQSIEISSNPKELWLSLLGEAPKK